MKASLGVCLLTAGLALMVGTEQVSAQYYQPQFSNPYAPPPFSPYLNLHNAGNPAINYFGMVKPQMDSNRQMQLLQQQQAKMMQMGFMGINPEGEPLTGYSITGHPTAFFYYGHYFVQSGRGGGLAGRAPTAAPSAVPAATFVAPGAAIGVPLGIR